MRSRSIFGVVVATAAALATSAAAGTASAGTTLADATVERQVAFSEPSCVENERVFLTGTIRQRFHLTADGSGGLHLDLYYSAHGQGSGFDILTDPLFLTPVASYTASDEQIQSFQLPEPTFTANTVFNTRVIRQAERVADDDLYMVTRMHMTWNGNGIPTVDRFEERLECR
jgi:hypothetical protein